MDDLNWLAAHRFQEALRDDYSWTFVFDGEVRVNVGCLWRLLEEGSICTTSQDDGHKFGRLAAVDAALEVNQRLAASTSSRQAGSTSSPLGGVAVTSVVLRDGTLDLAFHFATGHVLQLIPESSGYEAWSVDSPTGQFVAAGGGNLATYGPRADGS